MIGDRRGEANTLTSLGEAALAQGRYADAIERYDQALPIYRQIGDRRGEANALRGKGQALAATGSPSGAANVAEAARLFELLGDAAGAAEARALEAEVGAASR